MGPLCPKNYTWVPELGRTCLKLGEVAGTDNNYKPWVDYLTGFVCVFIYIYILYFLVYELNHHKV